MTMINHRAARPHTFAAQPEAGEEPWEPLFRLDPAGVPADRRRLALDAFREHIAQIRSTFLGYQANEHTLDYSRDLSWLLDVHVNNIGDPFQSGNFRLNSKAVERHVLDYFATLWHASTPHGSGGDSYWGYVLSMGSTEGNITALWNARDYLSGKALLIDPERQDGAEPALMLVRPSTPAANPNAYRPVAFFSEDTHYSFTKAVRILEFPTFFEIGEAEYRGQCPLSPDGRWPAEVPSAGGAGGHGTIDIDKLAILVEFFASKGHPVMVSLNYGSTFKGAYDDVEGVIDRLLPIFKKYGLVDRVVEYGPGRTDVRHGFWIHVDGALGASYMPFLRMAAEDPGRGVFVSDRIPRFDFELPYVFSIVTSGHKWPGAPWPCGVYMTKVKYQLRPPDDPQYIGALDSTLAGSRSGFSPLVLWDHFAKYSYRDQIDLACRAQFLAGYAADRLLDLSHKIGIDLWAARSPMSLAVRFRSPTDKYVRKYSLAQETLTSEKERLMAHIYLMPGTDPALVDEFINDLAMPDAYPRDLVSGTEWTPDGRVREAAALGDVGRVARVPSSGRGFR